MEAVHAIIASTYPRILDHPRNQSHQRCHHQPCYSNVSRALQLNSTVRPRRVKPAPRANPLPASRETPARAPRSPASLRGRSDPIWR